MDRRYERLGCAALALLGAVGSIAFAFFLPAPPEAPRWVGAGAQTPQVGGTFVFHHEANVRSLDPHVAYDELSGMAGRLMFDGLLDYDQESNLVPSLAEAMPTVSEDGRTFRFRLRGGVRFHPMPGHPDGRELVAEDVRWSMLRLMSQDVGSPGYPFYASIEGADAYHEGNADDVPGIRVIDRYTIEFQLKEADQTFLNAMAMGFSYPVPRENYEHWGDEVTFHPVGTGPFVFEAWERGVQLTFTRNERYWRDKPGPERMLYLENIGRELAAQRFRNGDIDSIHRQSPSDYRFFKTSEAWRPYMVEEPRGSTYGLGFNCEMAPFDDVHVRRAIAFALDREGWSRARAGRLLPASQLLPPSIPGYDPELPTRQVFDLDRAREEMRLAGHPDGLPEPITVWIAGQDDTSRQYGELLQADLARIGIDVRLRFVSFAVYLTESGKPNTVPAFFTGWNLDFPDPSNFLFLFDQQSIHPEHSENRSFYRNPEFDRLLAEAKSERDRERRLGLYRQANEIVARDAPWAFLYYTLTMELWQPYVRNYDPHPVWSEDYREVWLDLPRERVARSLAGVGGPVPARFYPMGALR
jgi:ABC-type transport system substrate-binding protein